MNNESMIGECISRRGFLAWGAASVASLAAPQIATGADSIKRNVLFIASDDLNNSLGCYGNPLVKTPNIDRLARMSVRFDRAYCQYSLCSPSRSSLLTGMAPDTTRVWDNETHFRQALPNVVTLPQAFQKNDYFVARAGKIFHYGNPEQIGTCGLDDPASWQETVNPAGIDHLKDEPLVTDYTPKRKIGSSIEFYASGMRDDQHTDYLVADAVIDMMEQHRSDPWFLGAGFYKPHCPWIVPSKYFDLHPINEIQVPPFSPDEMRIAPEWAYFTKPANWGMSAQERRETIRAYYASISFVDAQVGRLLDALDRLRLTANTVVVFWADHGYHLGEHGQWMKQTLFEPPTRVPLLIGGAGIPVQSRGCQRTVEHLDIYPTLLELCGLEHGPENLQGRSLMPLLRNPDSPWGYPAVTQVGRKTKEKQVMGYSLRTERYRYTFWAQGSEGEEFYDYDADPRELRNLAHDPASEPLKQKLRKRLMTICQSRGMETVPGATSA